MFAVDLTEVAEALVAGPLCTAGVLQVEDKDACTATGAAQRGFCWDR